MPVVTYADGRVKHVKNLAWLLRHARQITSLSIIETFNKDGSNSGGVLRAVLKEEGQYKNIFDGPEMRYASCFADYSVLKSWVQRPSFSHVTINER